jgi:hypothetical protein
VLPLNAPFAWLYLLPPFSLSRFPLGWGYLGALTSGFSPRRGSRRCSLARCVGYVQGGWLLAAIATGQAVVVLATIPAGLVPALRFDEPMAARRAARLAR